MFAPTTIVPPSSGTVAWHSIALISADNTIQRVTTGNFQGGSNTSVTDNPAQVVNDPLTNLPYYNPNFFHNNSFNWLLVDGHAEVLPQGKTVTNMNVLNIASKMWTITTADD